MNMKVLEEMSAGIRYHARLRVLVWNGMPMVEWWLTT